MKWLLLALILLWASYGTIDELPRIINGIPYALDYLAGMYPPDWSILPSVIGPLIETLRMAIVSIVLSAMMAIPLSFLAAKDTTPNVIFYVGSAVLITFLRTIPTLLWAILFVAMVGLGPLAGVFALIAHCVGALGKYFQESIEAIVPKIIDNLEAMQVDGASNWQVIYYGILPQIAPLFASYILYYFDWCMREGTTLGLVGAGGVGLTLTMTIRLFKRQQTSAIILAIIILVMIVHVFSRMVRKKLLD